MVWERPLALEKMKHYSRQNEGENPQPFVFALGRRFANNPRATMRPQLRYRRGAEYRNRSARPRNRSSGVNSINRATTHHLNTSEYVHASVFSLPSDRWEPRERSSRITSPRTPLSASKNISLPSRCYGPRRRRRAAAAAPPDHEGPLCIPLDELAHAVEALEHRGHRGALATQLPLDALDGHLPRGGRLRARSSCGLGPRGLSGLGPGGGGGRCQDRVRVGRARPSPAS